MNRISSIAFVIYSLFTFVTTSYAQVPSYIWAKTVLGNVEAIQRGAVVDGSGNVYITGVFFGTVDFDPGTGIVNLTPNPYGCNAYIAKYDANGNYLWVKNIPINASYGNNSIAIDGNSNVFITGFYSGTAVDFNPGVGVAAFTSVSASNDAYLAKYDSNGNYLWAISIGSSADDRGNEVVTDASGNVLVTGNFSGTVDFDPGVATANLTSAGSTDIFFAKYSANGNYIWAKQLGGTGADDVRDMTIKNDTIYLTGNFNASADFDPGTGVANLLSAGSTDIFFAKYDPSGNYQWAKACGSTGIDCGTGVTVNASGDIYFTGTFNATVDFDAGPGSANITAVTTANAYITKYDASGNYTWVKRLPLNVSNIDIVPDQQGNLFISGSFASGSPAVIDMDPGAGTANLNVPSNLPPPYYNIFARYDSNGNYLWANVFGHTCYCSVMGYKSSLATDANGYVYYSGIFNGSSFGSATVDFDPNASVANLTAPSSVDNTFFTKYGTVTTPFPVELLSFSGFNKGDINYLTWVTASEINNDYFDIERSEDGNEFKKIGNTKGHGNSTQQIDYSFDDTHFTPGTNYYRLRQVDFNGSYEYSNVISIKNKLSSLNCLATSDGQSNRYTLLCDEIKNADIKIFDARGKIIRALHIGFDDNNILLDLTNYAKGIYLVLINESGNNFSLKLLNK